MVQKIAIKMHCGFRDIFKLVKLQKPTKFLNDVPVSVNSLSQKF